MHTTYLKDCSDIAYPLVNSRNRPFSDSILLDMAIGICNTNTAAPVMLSYLSTKNNGLYVELSYAGAVIGAFTHTGTDAGMCTLTPRSNVSAKGVLVVGSIPTAQQGLEWHFTDLIVHPSCVTVYRDNAFSGILEVEADNGTFSADKVMTITAYNGVSITASHIEGEAADLPVPSDYAKITSINDTPVTPDCTLELITSAETIDKLRFAGNGGRTRRKGCYAVDGGIVVTINGTQAFPSCYTKDEAATDGAESDKLAIKEGGRI